jgi:hypothetical protein
MDCRELTFRSWLDLNIHNKIHCLGSSLCLLALDDSLSLPAPNVGVTGGISSTQVCTDCSEFDFVCYAIVVLDFELECSCAFDV